MRKNLDISAYLVIGPENTMGRPVSDVITQALRAGFTCVQIRSKECSARDLITYTIQAADAIAAAGKANRLRFWWTTDWTLLWLHVKRGQKSMACM